MDTILVLDCNFLCYRAFYTTGDLYHEGVATGVAFGFFREMLSLQKRFFTDRFIFCWDGRRSLRREVYPSYKGNRKKAETKEEKEKRRAMLGAVADLQHIYLTELGFENNFCCDGFEADDIIASVVKKCSSKGRHLVIVSADRDLFQLLSPSVRIYNPLTKREYTYKMFKKEFNIDPFYWYRVKAMAGCATDNIKGIQGVGEKTAAKYIAGQVKKGKMFKKIKRGLHLAKKNALLVKLPFKGTPTYELTDDNISIRRWKSLCSRLGMRKMARDIPLIRRR